MEIRYRKGVGIVLYNHEKKIFMGQRIDNQAYWQFPQGGIDLDEKPLQAAHRELKEETGAEGLVVKKSRLLRYSIPQEVLATVSWGHRYQGQEQYWFAMAFKGTNQEIDLKAYHTPEFCAWRWVHPAECTALVIPFKQQLYKEILEEFEDVLQCV